MDKIDGTITKSELAARYKFTLQTLSQKLNHEFYEDLLAVGYKKRCRILPPIVLSKFFDLYGPPVENF